MWPLIILALFGVGIAGTASYKAVKEYRAVKAKAKEVVDKAEVLDLPKPSTFPPGDSLYSAIPDVPKVVYARTCTPKHVFDGR